MGNMRLSTILSGVIVMSIAIAVSAIIFAFGWGMIGSLTASGEAGVGIALGICMFTMASGPIVAAFTSLRGHND